MAKSIKDEPPSKKSKFDQLLSMKKESASSGSNSDESDTTEDDDWKPAPPVEATVTLPKKAAKEKLMSKLKKVAKASDYFKQYSGDLNISRVQYSKPKLSGSGIVRNLIPDHFLEFRCFFSSFTFMI